MKFANVVVGVVALTMLLFTILILFPDIVSLSETARTQAATSTPGCTSDTAGVCTITLDSDHQYSTTTFMTVTETSPGSADRTSGTTVGSDRAILTVTGLNTTPTAYLFSVDYLERNALVSEATNEVLARIPLILVIGALAVGIAGSIASWAVMRGGGGRRRR